MQNKQKYLIFIVLLISSVFTFGQSAESENALMKINRIWTGIPANADKGSYEFRAGFFPNDYNLIGFRGQYKEMNTGAGFRIVTTNWFNPYADSVEHVAVYNSTSEWFPVGKVTQPITSYMKIKFPEQIIDYQTVDIEDFGVYDPAKFNGVSYDQIVEATNEYVYGIQLNRKVMAWSQSLNDNYLIFDCTFTNPTSTTFDSIYISMKGKQANSFFSNGMNPSVSSAEAYNPAYTWQHYYGSRVGDSLRIFYEYSADNPDVSGDNMGAPVSTQQGRLIGSNMFFLTVLHASKEPYTNNVDDKDDFLQPKITYQCYETALPYASSGDDYGSKNFWSIRGGYANYFPADGNTWPNTFHGGNNDEQGSPDFSNTPAGSKTGVGQDMFMSFGPYTFAPGQKIRIVYAVGLAGLDLETAYEVGNKWLNGTLENPPNMPDPDKGWLPSNFAFPSEATEMDKKKDRWISSGIDSVMKSAYRAKWNFDNNYTIPGAPPPPSYFEVKGTAGKGVEITWKDNEAEILPNFAGYRIMRRVSTSDTIFYRQIYDSDGTDKANDMHIFNDQSFLPGAQYYYFIQAKAKIAENDLTASPETRGKIIYSSRALIPNIFYVNPPTQYSDDMSKIRIVPNPYNINDPLLGPDGYGFTDRRSITFYNLPPTATIRIYTESGDLIRTIEHDWPDQRGSEAWDLLTSSQQVITSGVYIAVIEKPSGELTYQKFVVVR